MKNKKIKFGIIGGGMIGEVHIKSLLKDNRAEVVWLSTRNKKRLKELTAKYKIHNTTTNYMELLADSNIDAVIVATPPFTHLEIGKAVLNSNKNLILEKPLVTNLKELNAFSRIVNKKKDLFVIECSARHSRLQPKFPYIKKLIASGKIGEIYHIDHRHLTHGTFIEYNPKGAWALDKAKSGGGPFIDWGVYDLSFHLGLFDDTPKLESISHFTKCNLRSNIKSNVEQHGAALMKFNNGLTYYYERGNGVHYEVDNRTIIYGTKGSCKFSYCSWESNKIQVSTELKSGKLSSKEFSVNMKNHKDDNEVFASYVIDCLLGKRNPILNLEIAKKNLHILFKILK